MPGQWTCIHWVLAEQSSIVQYKRFQHTYLTCKGGISQGSIDACLVDCTHWVVGAVAILGAVVQIRSTHVFDMQGVPVQASIDACPVDCIHWVDREQLPALEHVMQKRMGRTNVGVMMAGQGVSNGDVFALTDRFLKERDARCGCSPIL